MFTQIKNQYSEANQIAKSVLSEAMPKDIFMGHIRKGIETLFVSQNVLLNNCRMHANILEHYLNKFGVSEIIPDEIFIQQMWERLKDNGQFGDKTYGWSTRKKVPRFIRKIINEYFYPNGLVQRKLLKGIVVGRYERYLRLTKNSQEAIKWFEQNGKRVEVTHAFVQNKDIGIDSNATVRIIHTITNRELLPLTKNGKIEHAIRFLEYVNLNGFEEATKEHVQKFEEVCKERGIKQTQDYLAHVATFFINIYAKGFIKSNPFAQVSLKMKGEAVKKDFVSVEGIAKIRDLSTLDKTNRDDVRDRFFAILGYDLALRISELLSLRISDFRKESDGEWSMLLRGEIQKGHKDDDTMYFFFDETKELLELYINGVRNGYKPKTEHLFISNQGGKPLSTQQCSLRFRKLCQKLDIKTFYGKNPSPHLLRHSFATLNIQPLGISIPLYELVQRLRHENLETTRKHYIHNNPYLIKIKHEAYLLKARKKTPFEILDEIPLADWIHYLLEIGCGSKEIEEFKEKHKKAFPPRSTVRKEISAIAPSPTVFIPEEEALERLKKLNITPFELRQYAVRNNALADVFSGSIRYGHGFRYREAVIDDLAQNWSPAGRLRGLMKLKLTRFWELAKERKWRSIKVGRRQFIHKMDWWKVPNESRY